MELNTDHIYLLPDGREVVLHWAENLGYQLFDPKLGVAAAPVYCINRNGRILFWGKETPWQIGDLTDTGRRAVPRQCKFELV